ncbi:MAG: hypothetical protein AB7T49_14180 [Oligoflexales bacterium]
MRVLVLLTILAGCKSAGPMETSEMASETTSIIDDYTSASKLEDSVRPLECASGKETRLSLKPVNNLPDISTLPFAGWTKVTTTNDNNDFNTRLDVCFDEISGTAELKRIVHKLNDAFFVIMSVKEDAVVEGLIEALFGDTSGLNIVNPYGKWVPAKVKNRIVIKGIALKAGESIVGIIQEKQEGDAYVPFTKATSSNSIVVGELVANDPFSAGCEMTPVTKTLQIETAEIKLDMCSGMGTSMGAYTITNALITDTNSNLPENIRGTEVKAQVTRKSHHHDICDSISLKTLDAEYFLTAGAMGGTIIDEFQVRECTDSEQVLYPNPKPPQGALWNLVYKFVYLSNNSVKEGRGDKWHWFHGE